MYMKSFCILLLLYVLTEANCAYNIYASDKLKEYEPTWASLDNRPLPKWYDENKVGIFIHWGVFAVPSFGSEWFWANWKDKATSYVHFMEDNYAPGFTYQEFAKDFTAEFFNATEWAEIFKMSGAKYVVLTSKHHEGFTLWPSKYAFSWNSLDIGPHRDIIRELSTAVRKAGLRFGLYHSLYEWFNPLYLADKASNFTKADFVHHKILPEMTELIEQYLPDVLWSDGDWESTDDYWQSKQFLAWLYNESPVKNEIVVNDRWGSGIPCKHGGFYTCTDRYNPGVLQPHKWENAMTIDKKSWGYRRNAPLSDYLTTFELIKTMTETVSCGGNILMNIGPSKDGIIKPIFQERLQNVGNWLSVNGEAIYDSVPWKHQNDTTSPTWYTSKNNNTVVYAITLKWPDQNKLKLGYILEVVTDKTTMSFLGNSDQTLKWTKQTDHVEVDLLDKATVKSKWAYVVKIVN